MRSDVFARDIRAWLVLHAVMGLGILTLLLALSGCEWLEAEEKPPKLGPEVSVADLQSAIDAAFEGITESTLVAGDASLYETNIRVDMSAPVKTSQLETHVDARIDCGSQYRLVLKDTFTEFGSGGETDTTITDRVIDVDKPDAPAFASHGDLDLLESPLKAAVRALSDEPETRQTLHNLRVREVTLDPPQANPDCLRFTDCKIKATEIRVDLATWESRTKARKTEILWQISKDLPAIASTVVLCQNQLFQSQGRSFFVNQCEVLRDLLFGDPNVPADPGTPGTCPASP